jgi:hypothetical protein
MFWPCFLFYYAIGFYVSTFVTDDRGAPPKLWHVPAIALVWPVLFLAYSDE